MWSGKRAAKPLLIVEGEEQMHALNADSLGTRPGAPVAPRRAAGASRDSLRCAPVAVRALVSDSALRWLTLPWNVDLLRQRSAIQQFDLHTDLMFGKEPEGLVYAQTYAPFGQPQCVAGLTKPLLESIHAFARARNLSVTSLQPLGWACWEHFRKVIAETDYLFAVVERSAVTLLVVANKRVERVVSRGYLENPVAELATMWHRMQLREPQLAEVAARYAFDITGAMREAAATAGFTALDADEEASGTDSAAAQLAAVSHSRRTIDFISSAPPMKGWRSVLLVAGLACLALFGAQAGLAYSERASRAADMEERSAIRLPVGPRQSDRAQIRSVNQAITALNLPVGALLRSIQPPRELHTALLGLDLSDIRSDTHTATLKITAESRTGAEMTAYVECLARSPIFAGVFLTRHEIVEAGDEHSYRYEIEAAWRQ